MTGVTRRDPGPDGAGPSSVLIDIGDLYRSLGTLLLLPSSEIRSLVGRLGGAEPSFRGKISLAEEVKL